MFVYLSAGGGTGEEHEEQRFRPLREDSSEGVRCPF
jgi:hypothetical protein